MTLHEKAILALVAAVRNRLLSIRESISRFDGEIADLQTSLRTKTVARNRLKLEAEGLENAIVSTMKELTNVDREQSADSNGPDGPTGPDIVAT